MEDLEVLIHSVPVTSVNASTTSPKKVRGGLVQCNLSASLTGCGSLGSKCVNGAGVVSLNKFIISPRMFCLTLLL